VSNIAHKRPILSNNECKENAEKSMKKKIADNREIGSKRCEEIKQVYPSNMRKEIV
jgi:hypothetical protein